MRCLASEDHGFLVFFLLVIESISKQLVIYFLLL
jgi:hypothetical protein